MEGLNKIVSFILGLVVVIVFFAVVTKRIDLKNIGKKNSSNTAVSTKAITPTPKTISSIKINPTNRLYPTSPTVPSTIPSTGLPTVFIPILLAGLFGGSKLRRAGKNK